jgi:ribose-phosphate pyrophosphokinase
VHILGRGEIAIFSLPSNIDYANKVCEKIVEISHIREKEIAEELKAIYGSTEEFQCNLADFQGIELIIQANSRGLLDERQEAEFRMIRVLQRNLLLAGLRINSLEKKYDSRDSMLTRFEGEELTTEEQQDKINYGYWDQIIKNGGLAPIPIKHNKFADGEQNVQILESVAERDAYLIAQVHDHKTPEEITREIFKRHPNTIRDQSLFDELNKLVCASLSGVIYKHKGTLEIFCDALTRARVSFLNVVMPYLLHSRGDKPHASESITSSIITRGLSNLGVNILIALGLHSAQVRGQGDPRKFSLQDLSFRYCIEEHVLKYYFEPDEDFIVVSTDEGGAELAGKYAEDLGKPLATAYKARRYDIVNSIKELRILGNVNDANLLVVDDELDTGGTLETLIEEANKLGAKRIIVAVTHGKFSDPKRIEYFRTAYEQGKIDKVIIGDTIPHSDEFYRENKKWLDVIDTTQIFGQAIYHINCSLPLRYMYERQINRVYNANHDS